MGGFSTYNVDSIKFIQPWLWRSLSNNVLRLLFSPRLNIGKEAAGELGEGAGQSSWAVGAADRTMLGRVQLWLERAGEEMRRFPSYLGLPSAQHRRCPHQLMGTCVTVPWTHPSW